MGFFDCRCMVTGVSLKGADTALVLLHPTGDGFVPASLALKGNYNRLGSIDGIEEDTNNRLVLNYFLERLADETFVVDVDDLTVYKCFPIETVEQLLQGCERNMNGGEGWAVLHGQSVVFALIARRVWDTLATLDPPTDSPLAQLSRHFPPSSYAPEIYAGVSDALSGPLREFAAVDQFLAARGLRWQASPATGQDYPEEMREYLAEAKAAFADSPSVLAALGQYECEVGNLLSND